MAAVPSVSWRRGTVGITAVRGRKRHDGKS
jgi:hypothetical protein